MLDVAEINLVANFMEVRTFCLLIPIRSLCTLCSLNASLMIQKERTGVQGGDRGDTFWAQRIISYMEELKPDNRLSFLLFFVYFFWGGGVEVGYREMDHFSDLWPMTCGWLGVRTEGRLS